MNRRAFCQHLALLSAGAAALPAQLSAFERLYEVNTRKLASSRDIISIRDLVFGFSGPPLDDSVVVTFFDGEEELTRFPLNTRGSMRCAVPPDCPMISTHKRFRWEIRAAYDLEYATRHLAGTVRYLDMEGVIHNVPMSGIVTHL